jgi:hypothetical protein
MKKVFVLSIMSLFISTLAFSQVRFGVKGGLNLANISNTNSGGVDNGKTLPSFHVGVIADFGLSEILSLQPGVYYSGKGIKTETGKSGDPVYHKLTTSPQYIEVPINFVGKIPVGGNARIFIGAGPYAGFGIAGKIKSSTQLNGGATTSTEVKIKWDDDTPFTSGDLNQGLDKLKRFDFGGNVLAGVEIGNFLVSAQYGIGFAKINSGGTNSADDKNKNRVFSVSIGYMLGNALK